MALGSALAMGSVVVVSIVLGLSTLPFLGGAFEAMRDFIADAFGAARFGIEEKKSSIADGTAGFNFLLAGPAHRCSSVHSRLS